MDEDDPRRQRRDEMSKPTKEQLEKLWATVKAFIEENEIICSESCYQMDDVLENSAPFIESLCDIVGYQEGLL